MVAQLLRFVGQVIGIDADAVPADESGAKRQEVPLGAGGFEHFFSIDTDSLEDHREFVDERDVHVTLRVLDHFGRFGDLDARGFVRARRDNRFVNLVDELRHLGRRTGGDFQYGRQPVFFIAGVDALGAVANEEILVHPQT